MSVAIQAARVVGELRMQLIYRVRTYILGFQAARGDGESPYRVGSTGVRALEMTMRTSRRRRGEGDGEGEMRCGRCHKICV